jgi:hypothetical protein
MYYEDSVASTESSLSEFADGDYLPPSLASSNCRLREKSSSQDDETMAVDESVQARGVRTRATKRTIDGTVKLESTEESAVQSAKPHALFDILDEDEDDYDSPFDDEVDEETENKLERRKELKRERERQRRKRKKLELEDHKERRRVKERERRRNKRAKEEADVQDAQGKPVTPEKPKDKPSPVRQSLRTRDKNYHHSVDLNKSHSNNPILNNNNNNNNNNNKRVLAKSSPRHNNKPEFNASARAILVLDPALLDVASSLYFFELWDRMNLL